MRDTIVMTLLLADIHASLHQLVVAFYYYVFILKG
jgi:hypothetical protein